MKYKVLKPIIYDGKEYKVGQEVDILEKEVAKNCLERKLIEEIKDTVEEVVSEPQKSENVEDTEDRESPNTETDEDEKLKRVEITTENENTSKTIEEKKENTENKQNKRVNNKK